MKTVTSIGLLGEKREDEERDAPRIGSGGPAGTADQVERAAAWRRPLGAARVRGRAMACIFIVVVVVKGSGGKYGRSTKAEDEYYTRIGEQALVR